jgi:hypothetical protein
MSRKLSGPHIKASLPEIEHRLKSYSIAAAAAGVGLFSATLYFCQFPQA